jgi:hypothetical protein
VVIVKADVYPQLTNLVQSEDNETLTRAGFAGCSSAGEIANPDLGHQVGGISPDHL